MHTLASWQVGVAQAVPHVNPVHGCLLDGHGVCLGNNRDDRNYLGESVHIEDIDVAQAVWGEAEKAQVDSRIFHLQATRSLSMT